MSEMDELRDKINELAEAIAGADRNPRSWLTYIVYLLDRLEQQALGVDSSYQRTYTDTLTALRDTIRNRLNTGGW
jgi:hypothetical protein